MLTKEKFGRLTAKIKKNKINESKAKLKSEKSNNYAYNLFEKDFNDALIRINKNMNDFLNFADLCNLMIELKMIGTIYFAFYRYF